MSEKVRIINEEDLDKLKEGDNAGPIVIVTNQPEIVSRRLKSSHPINLYVVKRGDEKRLSVLIAQLRVRRVNPVPITEDNALTRREFLMGRLSKVKLVNAPVVSSESCIARYGCTRCVDSCPSGALTIKDKSVNVNPSKCIECGVCVSECPTGALAMAGADDEEYTVAINEASRAGFRRLRFTCIYDESPSSGDEFTYKLPCIASVGPEWLTMALTLFNEVSITCPNESCKLKGLDKVRGLIDNLAKVINVEVNGLTIKVPKEPENHPTYVGLRRSDYSNALKAMKHIYKGEVAQGLKIFNVKIDNDKCSFCGVCFAKCPLKTFDVDNTQGLPTLKFNPLKCVGCGYCVNACPEKAMNIEPGVINDEWVVKVKDEVVRCRMCGKPFDTLRHIKATKARLGIKGDPEWLYLCPDCRRYYTAKQMLKANLKPLN